MKTKLIAGFVVTLLGLSILTGCSEKTKEPFKDAPQEEERNSDPAQVIEMPDGFSNLATKCDHGNRIYVIYKGDDNRGAVSVVADDPTCSQAG